VDLVDLVDPRTMKSFQNFVNGVYVDASDGRTSAVVNPVTGEQYATAALSGGADVDAAMKAAETAFESWRDTTPSQRSLASSAHPRARSRSAGLSSCRSSHDRRAGSVWTAGQ